MAEAWLGRSEAVAPGAGWRALRAGFGLSTPVACGRVLLDLGLVDSTRAAGSVSGSLRERMPRRSAGDGNGHPVPRPPRTPTAELTEDCPPAPPFPPAVVLGAAGAGAEEASGVLAGRVAPFTRVVLAPYEDVRVPAEQLLAYAGEVSAGNRPATLAAVPSERSIASDPAREFPLVLPHRVSRKPDAEPPVGRQADGRQVLTSIVR